jgi:excisionase family DNA binding protein
VLTLAEAAAYLRVSEDEVDELAAQGELPGRIIRGQWRFLKAALQDWLRWPTSQKTRLMQLAGAWKDDPYFDEMLDQIYRERGRPMLEEPES